METEIPVSQSIFARKHLQPKPNYEEFWTEPKPSYEEFRNQNRNETEL